MPSLPEYFTVSESIFTVYRKNSKITLQDNGHRNAAYSCRLLSTIALTSILP